MTQKENTEDKEYLLGLLEALVALKKGGDDISALTYESLYASFNKILRKLLQHYDPATMEKFIAAARKGEIF